MKKIIKGNINTGIMQWKTIKLLKISERLNLT